MVVKIKKNLVWVRTCGRCNLDLVPCDGQGWIYKRMKERGGDGSIWCRWKKMRMVKRIVNFYVKMCVADTFQHSCVHAG